jgi:hypothetical protein
LNRYTILSQDGGPFLAMVRLLFTSNADLQDDPLYQRAKAMLHVAILNGGPFHTLMSFGKCSSKFWSPLFAEYLALSGEHTLGHIGFTINMGRLDDTLRHSQEIGTFLFYLQSFRL